LEWDSNINIINKADSGLVEEVKWGSGVWVKNGNVCAVCAMKNHVKMNFFQGASLADPEKLFNAGLDAKKTRAIDFHKDDKINEDALTKLIQAAVSEIGKK